MAEFIGDQCPERAVGLTHTQEDGGACEHCGQPLTRIKSYVAGAPPTPEVRKVAGAKEGPLARRKRMRWARPIDDHETSLTKKAREDRLFRELGTRGRRRLEFLKALHDADPKRFL
jgi:hypothetical protein